MGKLEDSMEAYANGLKIDPTNAAMKQGMEALRREGQAKMGGMGGGGGMSDMLCGPEAEAKLMANPETKKYFDDPQFAGMW